jgi:hypothetical protein
MKVLVASLAILASITAASAGVQCYTDTYGNTYCNGNGDDSGVRFSCYTDTYGNTYCN